LELWRDDKGSGVRLRCIRLSDNVFHVYG